MSDSIGIVTVLYNSAPVLPDFFRTLAQQEGVSVRLYVVDNASTDDGLALTERLAGEYGIDICVIANKENRGISGGNNDGIRRALADGMDYILLANNDIEMEPDAIATLLDGMKRHEADLAVGKIYFFGSDRTIWCAGGRFQYIQCATCHLHEGEKDTGQADEECLCDYAPTCFMLIRSDVFGKVGMMDENLFVYFDDTDFVWRATRRHGLKMWYIPASLIHHKVSSSTGGAMSDFTIRQFYKNHIYFALKNGSAMQKACFMPYLLYDALHKRLSGILDGRQWRLALKSRREGWHLYRHSDIEGR